MAVDTFLRLDQVPGESKDAHHRDEIDVLTWSWGVSRAATSSGGSGAGVGRPRPTDLVFTHRYDKASPLLVKHCAKGTHLTTGVLSMRRLGAHDFLTVTLSGIQVTSVTVNDDGAGEIVETASLAYGEIQVAYRPQDATGSLGTPVTVDWDIRTGAVT